MCELVDVQRERLCFEELIIHALEWLTQALQKPASIEDACALVATAQEDEMSFPYGGLSFELEAENGFLIN